MSLLESLQTFFLKKSDKEEQLQVKDNNLSPVAPSSQNGEVAIVGGVQSAADTSAVSTSTPNDKELIELYRSIARIPEVAEAVDEIVNEIISVNDEGEPVSLDLEELELSESVKKKIREEFDNVLDVVNFDTRGHDLVRRWYIDGRLAGHKVIDKKKPADGIKEFRYINPLSLEKVIEYKKVKEGKIEVFQCVKEYYKYNPTNKTNTINLRATGNEKDNGSATSFVNAEFWAQQNGMLYGNNQIIAISPDAIATVTSGLFDEDFGTILSYLQPAIKTANQLTMMEDSLVVYRLSRSTEKRIFYVDIGDLPKTKGEEYMRALMTKFKNTLSYDSTTGKLKDSKRFQSLMEDYWIPRRSDGRATEITTLPGGQNLGQLEDVDYFRNKLYKCLKVPASRFQTEQPVIAGIGRSSEITRDEIRFQKFVDKLRARFSELFEDLLGTQLMLKGIVSKDEWKELKKNVKFKWARDNFFTEMKEQEVLRERLTTLQLAEPYVGKFLTTEDVLKKILRVADDEYDDLKKNLEQEQADKVDAEYDAAIQQNDIDADKLDKTMKIQSQYDTGDSK